MRRAQTIVITTVTILIPDEDAADLPEKVIVNGVHSGIG
jgi:hypothetical protein